MLLKRYKNTVSITDTVTILQYILYSNTGQWQIMYGDSLVADNTHHNCPSGQRIRSGLKQRFREPGRQQVKNMYNDAGTIATHGEPARRDR